MLLMSADLGAAFSELKSVLAPFAARLSLKVDTPTEYTLYTKAPSPFPQHKGHPMFFASAKLGKAYASFHLMPLYMCPALSDSISPGLKKRMQGKTCFNFKTAPDPALLAELAKLTTAGHKHWAAQNWA